MPSAPLIVTRRELMRLSGFKLPAAGGGRRIPPLTYEQVRHFERRGCFDDYRLKATTEGRVLPIWKPWPRGSARLYSLEDVLTARLIAWLLLDGMPHAAIVETLRGPSNVRI